MSASTPDRRVWLWHHGPVDAPQGALVGWLDNPLADPTEARHHAAAVAKRLDGVEAVFASDRRRARQAARPLARALGARLEIDPALREIHYGAWEGRRWPEIRETDPEHFAAYMTDWATTPMPGGESYAALRARVGDWWARLSPTGPIAVVAHGGSLRALAAVLMGWDAEQAMAVSLAPSHLGVVDPTAMHPPRWNLPPAPPQR